MHSHEDSEILEKGWKTFPIRVQILNIFDSAGSFVAQSSHRQYIKEKLCSKKTFFTETYGKPDLTCSPQFANPPALHPLSVTLPSLPLSLPIALPPYLSPLLPFLSLLPFPPPWPSPQSPRVSQWCSPQGSTASPYSTIQCSLLTLGSLPSHPQLTWEWAPLPERHQCPDATLSCSGPAAYAQGLSVQTLGMEHPTGPSSGINEAWITGAFLAQTAMVKDGADPWCQTHLGRPAGAMGNSQFFERGWCAPQTSRTSGREAGRLGSTIPEQRQADWRSAKPSWNQKST